MNLHQNRQLFQQAIQATSQRMGIAEIYVEKDYWVTLALHAIFTSDLKHQVVFKGGTALSKCHRLIERFSEDIDLVTLREEGEAGNRSRKRLKEVGAEVSVHMPEVELGGVTNKRGMIRKTAHEYPKVFRGDYGQVRDVVILETSWLGHYEPYASLEVSTYIYEMMVANKQKPLAEEYGLLPFKLNVLDVKRTLCEKILSLVRFSYDDDPIAALRMKIRHIYDLHQLLLGADHKAFFESAEFDEMLNRVGADDVEGYKSNNKWLNHPPAESLIFKAPEETWKELKSTYSDSFSNLVYGAIPSESAILESLIMISDRLSPIIWNVRT